MSIDDYFLGNFTVLKKNTSKYQNDKVLVFRVVLANPLTSKDILNDILQEQCELANESKQYLPELLALTAEITA